MPRFRVGSFLFVAHLLPATAMRVDSAGVRRPSIRSLAACVGNRWWRTVSVFREQQRQNRSGMYPCSFHCAPRHQPRQWHLAELVVWIDLVNWVNFVSEGNKDHQTQRVPHAQSREHSRLTSASCVRLLASNAILHCRDARGVIYCTDLPLRETLLRNSRPARVANCCGTMEDKLRRDLLDR